MLTINWKKNWNYSCSLFNEKCFKERDRFLLDLQKPMQAQKRILEDILNVGCQTLFGRQHNFSKITSIKDFTKCIPIRDYNQLELWIDKEVELKGGVLSNSPIIRWLKTSGSTGNPKKIPYTKHWMSQFRVPALGVLFANYIKACPAMLSNPYATFDTQTVREHPKDFLNGIPYQGITNRDPLINKLDWHVPWYQAPWFSSEVPSDYDAKMYYRLRYLIGKDIRAILSINPSTLVALKQHFFKNLPLLIEEIFNGTVCGKEINDSSPETARMLEKLGEENSFSFKKIWQNLSLISCWTSATAKLYIPQLEELYPEVKILPFMTCGTEGIVTLPIDDHFITGPLAINQGFYEFIPASIDIDKIIKNGESVETLLFDDLKLDEEYHLIMSQSNGLCRMAVGDIYKVTDFYLGVPRIEFSRRHGTYYSFTGEKITETQILNAIERAYKKNNIHNSLFLCCPVWESPPYYKFLIEIKNEFNNSTFKLQLGSDIDYFLSELNSEYISKRQSNRLGPIKVDFIEIGTIESYHEQKKRVGNSVQFKYKPFQQEETILKELIERSHAL